MWKYNFSKKKYLEIFSTEIYFSRKALRNFFKHIFEKGLRKIWIKHIFLKRGLRILERTSHIFFEHFENIRTNWIKTGIFGHLFNKQRFGKNILELNNTTGLSNIFRDFSTFYGTCQHFMNFRIFHKHSTFSGTYQHFFSGFFNIFLDFCKFS